MKRTAANAAPPSTSPSPVTSGIAAFEVEVEAVVEVEVGVELEVCDPAPELAPEALALVDVTSIVELFVGVASALLAADETWAE